MSKIKFQNKFLNVACLGTTRIGDRGQVVIPAEVRRALKLKAGDKLFVFVVHGKVLSMIKTNALDKFLSQFSKKMLISRKKGK